MSSLFPWRRTLLVFFSTFSLYALTSSLAIRSPDEEVMFETADALATRRTFAVIGASDWPGFGLAPGKPGGEYSVFGPLLPLAAAPVVATARQRDPAAWPPGPISHYVDHGLGAALGNLPPERPAENGVRAAAVLVNAAIAALAVVLLYGLARAIAPDGALIVALLAALATPLWHYSGTFFSEPLSALLLIGAALAAQRGRAAVSGVLAALAPAAHVTGFLFLPFAAWIAIGDGDDKKRRALRFALGAAIPMALLGVLNAYHFGSPFETGRGVDPELAASFGYGTFAAPWRGLFGLLVAPGKSLLFFAPLVLVGLSFWPRLSAAAPRLARGLLWAFLVRLVFVAARSDWHGGFSLGPRLLVPMIPLLVLPWALVRPTGRWRLLLALLIGLAVAQQFAFTLGEPFLEAHRRVQADRSWFEGDRIYLEATASPALSPLAGPRSGFALQSWPLSDGALVSLATTMGVVAGWALTRLARGSPRPFGARP